MWGSVHVHACTQEGKTSSALLSKSSALPGVTLSGATSTSGLTYYTEVSSALRPFSRATGFFQGMLKYSEKIIDGLDRDSEQHHSTSLCNT